MGDRYLTGEQKGSNQNLDLVLPQLPNESNILSRQATEWIEQSETALAAKGYLAVSRGGLPPAALEIVDTPISKLPPDGGRMSCREDQQRLSILAENERNRQKREKLFLTAWTNLYTALVNTELGREDGTPSL